jgi:hypothetical protein
VGSIPATRTKVLIFYYFYAIILKFNCEVNTLWLNDHRQLPDYES